MNAMEERLRKKGVELLEKIETSPLFWEVLLRENVIRDAEEYTASRTRRDQVFRLLEYVKRGSIIPHYRGFLAALQETDQQHIIRDVLGEDIGNYASCDGGCSSPSGNTSKEGRARLKELLSTSQRRRARVKRCAWDQHKYIEVDDVFQPLVLQRREMTHMGVEKTTGSMMALFGSTENLNNDSDILGFPFNDLMQDGARICISGPRGCGKSTLLTKIEKDHTKNRGGTQDLIFHIDCEELGPDEPILDYIKQKNLPQLRESDEYIVNQYLGRGSDGMFLLFLLDNVDCLDIVDGEVVNIDVRNLLSSKSFPYSKVIGTTRCHNWNMLRNPRDIIFDDTIIIKGFSKESLEGYIKCFYEDTEAETKHDLLLKMIEDSHVFNLLRYPLHINFFLFAARDTQIRGRAELYTHVLRAIVSQSLDNTERNEDIINLLYINNELRMEILPQIGFITAAGEVALANMIGECFDVKGSGGPDHQRAFDVGILAVKTTDKDQRISDVYIVQHKELTEYLATIYLVSVASSLDQKTTVRRKRDSLLRRIALKLNSDKVIDKIKLLWDVSEDKPIPAALFDIIRFSASISIDVFQDVIKYCVSGIKDDCYDELRATKEWHSTIKYEHFQTMKHIMDVFLDAYAEIPPIWKERAGQVVRILTSKSFILYATKYNIASATRMMTETSPKYFTEVKGLLLVYRHGKGFPALLQQILTKCHGIKYLHILFYLEFPKIFPKGFSDFQSVSLPQGELIHLDLVLHGGKKVLDLYGIPLHNIYTRSLHNLHSLHSLCLRDAKLKEDDGMTLALIIKEHPKLEVLNLHNNPNLKQGLRPVLGVLQFNQRLRTLDISRTSITYEAWFDVHALTDKLKYLEFLELSMNQDLGQFIEDGSKGFPPIKTLKELHMRDCDLTVRSLNVCLESLCSSAPSLKVLDILDNNLDLPEDSCEFPQFLYHTKGLLSIFIHGNLFTQEWLGDTFGFLGNLKVDAISDQDRQHFETRFVTEMCMRVDRSIKSAPSGHAVSLYFLDDFEEDLNEDGYITS